MGIFSKDVCENCGKKLGKSRVERLGRKFCDDNCMKEYGKKHPPKNKKTCEFC